MRIKRKRRKRNQTKRKIIILSTVLISFTLITAYSAFSTKLTLTAKGTIYDKGELCYETSDNGDGTVSITNYDATCGTDVKIPEKIKGKTVTKISDTRYSSTNGFVNKGITSVTIPDTVKYIGGFSFYSNKISKLDLGNGVTEIAYEAFHNNLLETLIFPKSLKKIGAGAFLNNRLTEIPSLDNISYNDGAFANNNVSGDDAYIYHKNTDGTIDKTILNSYAGGKTWVSTLTLPEGIKELRYYSLRAVGAGTIVLPNSLEKINSSAIMQSTANTIEIPSTIKEIASGGFSQSPGIKTININRKENAIVGSPWGATNATVNWTGTN